MKTLHKKRKIKLFIVPGIVALFFLHSCTTSTEDTLPENISGRSLSLNEWYFMPDILDIGENEKWYDPDTEYREWKKVAVPSAWNTYDPSLWGYEGAGWYVIRIPADKIPKQPFLTLKFGRVNYLAKGWLNGTFLGEHIGGFLPFSWDISSLIRRDRDNVLVIKADNRIRPEWLPGNRQVEWVQYGGILQPAHIIGHDTLSLAGIEIDARPRGKGASVTCRVKVDNRSGRMVRALLTLRVREEKNTPSQKIRVTCPAGIVSSHTCGFTLPEAIPWSPSTPHLYHLEVELVSGKKITDQDKVCFGIRTVQTQGRHILINGQPLFIRGVNRYDIFGRRGHIRDREWILKDLQQIKEAGVNTIRVHYPQDPLLLDLLDEKGLFLIEELPLNWWGQDWWGLGQIPQDTSILQQARRTLQKMIERDRNHPCILAWSVANECKTETDAGNYVISSLIREAHRLDTTRPVTFTVNNETHRHPAFRLADIVSCNAYFGNDSAFRIESLDTLTRIPVEAYLQRQLAAYPDKPLLVLEFGAGGFYGIHGNAPLTEEFQAAYIRAVWTAIRNTPDCSGGILWCWRDFYFRKYFVQTYAPFGPYGVLNVDGKPKVSFSTLKEIFNKTQTNFDLYKNPQK